MNVAFVLFSNYGNLTKYKNPLFGILLIKQLYTSRKHSFLKIETRIIYVKQKRVVQAVNLKPHRM